MQAGKLLLQGLSQAEVARRLKVSRESVRRWWNQLSRDGSTKSLKKAGRAGRAPKLGPRELRKLKAILQASPAKSGYPQGPWTLELIARLIKSEFGVQHHPGHVSWILRNKLGGRGQDE